jgi:hypothetical protein
LRRALAVVTTAVLEGDREIDRGLLEELMCQQRDEDVPLIVASCRGARAAAVVLTNIGMLGHCAQIRVLLMCARCDELHNELRAVVDDAAVVIPDETLWGKFMNRISEMITRFSNTVSKCTI